jgi:hypothetical protein
MMNAAVGLMPLGSWDLAFTCLLEKMVAKSEMLNWLMTWPSNNFNNPNRNHQTLTYRSNKLQLGTQPTLHSLEGHTSQLPSGSRLQL